MNEAPLAGDSLAPLRVIQRLTVGPVVVEKNRIIAPYRVEIGDTTDETEFSYKYEEPVFTPGDRASENLAAMMAAQVALNYGLFCDEIVFHGPLDRADIRFLTDMAENTAREIYVNKLLADNPFLIGAAAGLKPEPRPHYLHARLSFPDRVASEPATWPGPPAERGRVAILSSGGKDSLLSQGLLTELGFEVHPVFGNESGRHWFTALNAYRGFAETVPHTARVWNNGDRVFTWMLRHLPFVRQDFANVRADIYPIRLWTVAVFLFGTLPLVRKRGIGRVVIGNEYDTTRRLHTHGIAHYDGLYDQSRFFDQALSRYYQRKRMPISQFSILRPISEFVVQNTLAARYPDLHRDQVSCHSAHKDGERVKPCGQCEKCRRIVGMLIADGRDPAVCGYTEEQVARCLKALEKGGIHQVGADAEHLLWRLAQKKRLSNPPAKLRAHPEVEQLRFDAERAPVDWIPADIRLPMLRLLAEHTQGIVRRVGRKWVSIGVDDAALIGAPYAFERGMPPMVSEAHPAVEGSPFLWAEMTWPIAGRRLREVDVALLPVGAIEQHGHHLPLDTDTFDADYLCRAVAAQCPDPKPLVLPAVPYGVSYHHDRFPGTISVSNETLARIIHDIGLAVARNGITKLVIINGHGGNAPTLNHAAQMINRDAHIFVCVDSGESSDEEIYKLIESPNDVHAGEVETSTSLAVRPHLVDLDLAEESTPKFSSEYLGFTTNEGVPWYAFTDKLSASGVMGDPTKATLEKGLAIWEIMIRHLVTFVEELKGMTLDEIYQKRY